MEFVIWFSYSEIRNFKRKKRYLKRSTLGTVAWNCKLLIVLEVFVLVIVKTLTIRSGRGESRAIWRTHWRPVLWVNFKGIGGFVDDGRMDSSDTIGNGRSLSNDFDGEEVLISFSGTLFVLELVDWNELK